MSAISAAGRIDPLCSQRLAEHLANGAGTGSMGVWDRLRTHRSCRIVWTGVAPTGRRQGVGEVAHRARIGV